VIPLRDENPSHGFPVVTVLIILLCVLVFLLEVNLGPMASNVFIEQYALYPVDFTAGFWGGFPKLITSMFLHGGWMHLIGNMWFLWIFGDNIEDFLGHIGFLFFYLGTGIAAGLVHVWMNPGSEIPTVGASGAISGVLGAYIFLHPHIRIKTLLVLGFFIEVVRIPALFFLGFWFLAQVMGMDPQVAYGAHIGGFVAGLGLIFTLSRGKPRTPELRFEPRRDARFHF